jgi:hypothetical protein
MAAARLASATPPPPFVLSRGIGWQVSSCPILGKSEKFGDSSIEKMSTGFSSFC